MIPIPCKVNKVYDNETFQLKWFERFIITLNLDVSILWTNTELLIINKSNDLRQDHDNYSSKACRPGWTTIIVFLATTNNTPDRLSVCLSVRPPVTPLSQCSSHGIIMKFSEVITIDKRDIYAEGQGQRSKVRVTEVKTQLSRLQSVTPVWINIW